MCSTFKIARIDRISLLSAYIAVNNSQIKGHSNQQ